MLLTKASEYAMLSLVLIAKQESLEDVDTLSKKLNISKSFLAKVLQALAKEGILKSFKGAKGGFRLNQNPSEISIKTVIEIAEKKPITVFECAKSVTCCPNNRGDFCSIWPFLNNFQQKIDEFLEDLTLEDLI